MSVKICLVIPLTSLHR